jgi:ParB family chromosome partitioning protein
MSASFTFVPALPVAVIVESPRNPRKRFDADALQQLVDSITERGVITPVIVRELDAGTRFELAAGHRRFRAAQLAGLQAIPAQVREMTDREFLEIMHLDNLQREGLDPLDEAIGYEELLSQGYDVSSLADKINKSITYVASRIRLLQLGTAAREAVRLGYVPVSHAIELAKIAAPAQAEVLEELWNLKPAALEQLATGIAGKASADAEDAPGDADDEAPEDGFAFADTEVALRVRYWNPIETPSLQELKRHMAHEVYRKLSAAQWDLNDESLLPEAGACTTCPKRRSHEPLLFAELTDVEDACLDRTCWEAKANQLFELKRGKVTRATKNDEHDDDDSDTAPTAPARDWNAERKRQEAKIKKQREKAQRARDAQIRAVLYTVPFGALSSLPWLVEVFVAVLRELTVDVIHGMLQLLNLDTAPPKADGQQLGFGWRRDRLEAWARSPDRTVMQLTHGLVLCALGYETLVESHSPRRPERLEAIGALTGLDLHKIGKDAEKGDAPAKATRRGKNAAAGDDTDDAPAEPVVKRGRGRPRKVATA